MKMNLRKTIALPMIGVMMLLVGGCDDLLTEVSKDASSINNFFQTIDDLDAAVTATYRQMVANPWNRGLGGARHRTIFCGADDWTSQPGGNKGNFKEGDQLAIRSSNSEISGAGWDLPYDVILQANFSIRGQADLKDLGVNAEQVDIKVAEAYMLRAWAYFRLVRLFGDVPIILNDDNGPTDFGVTRDPVSDVYAQILSDLEFAIEHLPVTQVERGRVNRWAAKALRANVYLTMASWPLKETARFADALSDAQDVIQNGPYALENDFASMFQLENEDTNTEYIWQLKFCNDTNCPSLGLITPFASQTTKPAELGGFQDLFIERTFFNNFPSGARKDHTFLTELRYQDGRIQPWQEFTWPNPFLSKFYDGGVDKNAPVEGQVGTTAPSSELDYPMIRLAEIYLIYAEAQSMGGGGNGSLALDYINQIRRRAKGVSINAADVDDLSSFSRQDVIDERGWEFVGEMKRWFDLTRTETLADALSDRHPDELPLLGDPNNQNLYYHPLPDLDIQINPRLTQNPR